MTMAIKNFFNKWNTYELCWLGIFSLVSIAITVITRDSFFGFTVFFAGILCVVLVAKGSIWTYPFGVYNTAAYAWMAYNNNLFGEMGLNLFFFMPMNVIGFFMWRRRMANGTVIMKALDNRKRVLIAFAVLTGIAALGYGLSRIDGQATPYIDASTNVLSVAATILMVMRFKEQWLLYIVLNVLTITMWSFRLAAGSPDAPVMIVMWSAYLINAFYGWYNWSKHAQVRKI